MYTHYEVMDKKELKSCRHKAERRWYRRMVVLNILIIIGIIAYVISSLIGHEMAHIRLGHATLHYAMAMLFSSMIPILSSTASRTREHSCDRIGQKLSGSDGIGAMMALTAGIHLYKQVDIEDYIENAKTVKGVFVWSYNLAATHPVTSKRVLVLAMKEGSGKLY